MPTDMDTKLNPEEQKASIAAYAEGLKHLQGSTPNATLELWEAMYPSVVELRADVRKYMNTKPNPEVPTWVPGPSDLPENRTVAGYSSLASNMVPPENPAKTPSIALPPDIKEFVDLADQGKDMRKHTPVCIPRRTWIVSADDHCTCCRADLRCESHATTCEFAPAAERECSPQPGPFTPAPKKDCPDPERFRRWWNQYRWNLMM